MQVYIDERSPTAFGQSSPRVPGIAFISTLLDDFFEESTADVFAVFVAVNVLFTELEIKRHLASQTLQGIGMEIAAYLQRASEKPSEHLEKGLIVWCERGCWN